MSKEKIKTRERLIEKARPKIEQMKAREVFTPKTNEGRKSKVEKKANRKRRSSIRRAKKLLESYGFCGFSIWYNPHTRIDSCAFSKEKNSYRFNITFELAQKIVANKMRLFDYDNKEHYINLEEYLKEQLIIKLSGLEEYVKKD